jgi:hypothetical protein
VNHKLQVAALQQQHSASLDEAERARVEHRFQLTERMQSLVADVRRQHEHAGADVGKALQGMAEVVRQAQQAQATARTKLQQLEDSHAKLAQRMTVRVPAGTGHSPCMTSLNEKSSCYVRLSPVGIHRHLRVTHPMACGCTSAYAHPIKSHVCHLTRLTKLRQQKSGELGVRDTAG